MALKHPLLIYWDFCLSMRKPLAKRLIEEKVASWCIIRPESPLSPRSQTTGFIRKELPIHYLGVPLFVGAQRSAYFQVLLERIRRKISHWKCHQLSKGGRIVLLQSVLLSMPIYLLSVLTPPATVLQRLNRIFCNFLWGAKEDGEKHHWIAWNLLCSPVREGGIGIRSLKEVCASFRLKLLFYGYFKLKTTCGQST